MAYQIRSVARSCPTLCDPMNRSTPGLPVHHQLPEFTETSMESVMPSSHLILCRPLLLLPPIPPSIRVLSNESTLRMRFSIVTFNVFGLFMLFMTFILEEYRIIIFYIIPQFWCMSLHCYSEIIHFILRYMSVHHIRNHTMSVCLMAVDAKFDNLRWYLSHF